MQAFCDPQACSPLGSSVRETAQARILQWVAISSFRGSSDPGIKLVSSVTPALAGRFLTTAPPGKPGEGIVHTKELQDVSSVYEQGNVSGHGH